MWNHFPCEPNMKVTSPDQRLARTVSRFFITLFVVCCCGCAALSQSGLKVGAKAPSFSGKAIDGATYSTESLQGKIFVLTFWATSCPICHGEIPKLNKLVDQYDSSKVVFVGPTNATEMVLSTYLKENPFKFHILPRSNTTMLKYADRDKDGDIDLAYPAYFLVDRTGVIQYRANGFGRIDQLRAEIERLLKR